MRVLVTGASKGLGFSIAGFLGSQHEVTGCARSACPPSAGFEYISGVDFADVSTFDRIPLGLFDGIVNNVGIAFDGLLATQSEEKISEVLGVNLVSTIILTKRYVRARLARREPGCIVNIGSIIGIRGYAGLVSYSASKAGLDGATRALARELGPKGFRVNCVLPGYMETDMSKGLSPAQLQQIVRRTPLGRLVALNEVAAVVGFLLSPGASSITGQSIVVDGGITI